MTESQTERVGSTLLSGRTRCFIGSEETVTDELTVPLLPNSDSAMRIVEFLRAELQLPPLLREKAFVPASAAGPTPPLTRPT